MSKRYCLLVAIISSLVTVTFTQYDYNYDYGSPSYEYDYPSRNGRSLVNYAGDSDGEPQARGVVDKFVGLFTGAKCVLVCIRKFSTDCRGLIGCCWKCMAPNEPLPEPDKVGEESYDDPKVEVATFEGSDDSGGKGKMAPDDIVRVAACTVQCLSKYLPRSKASLQRFLTCIVIRCFCDKRVNKAG